MKHLFVRFHKDEQATSLTEFILGLPIMIMVMSGILTIHHMHQDALEVNAESNRKAWAASLPSQTSSPISQLSPATAMISDVAGGNFSFDQGFGAAIGSLAADTPGGMYIDSYIKTKIANTLFEVGKTPEWNPQRIMEPNEEYCSAVSVSDLPGMPSGGGSVEGVLSGILTLGGARPGISGGIRYGSTADTRVTRNKTYSGISREFSAEYKLPFPTKPTNRTFAMAIAKLDMNAHPNSDASKAYRKAILPFKMTPQIITGDYPSVPSDEEIANQTEACKNDPDSCPTANDDAEVFHDKMDCYKEAAATGGDGSNC